jgi:hypothetical protein
MCNNFPFPLLEYIYEPLLCFNDLFADPLYKCESISNHVAYSDLNNGRKSFCCFVIFVRSLFDIVRNYRAFHEFFTGPFAKAAMGYVKRFGGNIGICLLYYNAVRCPKLPDTPLRVCAVKDMAVAVVTFRNAEIARGNYDRSLLVAAPDSQMASVVY